MRPTRLLALVVVLASPVATARAQAVAPPRWAAAVDSLITAELARARAPGGQVAVVQDGRVVYTKAYGVANVESGRPVTDRTLFQVGSVTKTITAAVLTQLAAEGTLDLDAPVSRYVTELAGRRVGTVTSRQLLAHTSGLADHAYPFGRSDDAAAGDLFRTISDTVFFTEPNRIFSYSNVGYSLAAYIAERAARTPYATLAERVVLRKLGMPRATLRPLVAMTYDFSVGHGREGQGVAVLRPTPGNSAEYGAGFLYASAAELARLEIALMSGGMLDGARVLSADAVRAMTTGYIRIPDAPHKWSGLGLQVDTVGGERVWRKSGGVAGFGSEMSMWPDRGLGVVVSVNRGIDLPTLLNPRIARLVAGVATEPDPLFTVASYSPTAAERAALVGRYRTAGANEAEVADSAGMLLWRVRGRSIPFRLVGPDRFVTGAPEEELPTGVVGRDSTGRVAYLHRGSRAFIRLP